MAESLFVYPRFVIVSFKMRGSDELKKIVIAFEIARKENHVKIVSIHRSFFAEHGSRSYICFKADDWLDPRAFCLFVKFHRAIENAVVGKGQGFKAFFHGGIHEVGNFGQAVEKGIVRVHVKMGERHK